jgi:antitoxin component YwqK of YwqJK toxin-antitoxin module
MTNDDRLWSIASTYKDGNKTYNTNVYLGLGGTVSFILNWYNNSERYGTWRDWYKSGKLRKETVYRAAGRTQMHKVWYENQQLKSEFYYTDNEHSFVRTWYHTGQPESEINYKNGMECGMKRKWLLLPNDCDPNTDEPQLEYEINVPPLI